MQDIVTERRAGSPAVLGLLLIVAGSAALALRAAGVDIAEIVETAGWPFFVIIPGLALLAAAVVASPGGRHGFVIAGSIVTAVGLLLYYQQATGHWESWAYAWALIPGASGLGTLVLGLFTARRDLVTTGATMAAIAGGLFLAGLWFFETLFESGRAPVDLGQWWPVVLIGVGLLVALTGLLNGPRRPATTEGDRP